MHIGGPQKPTQTDTLILLVLGEPYSAGIIITGRVVSKYEER